MKNNLENKSEKYQKLLLSASIKREAKKNEENKNAKKNPYGNNDNNNFIIYMEFKFENLILCRYLFEIRDELGMPIRSSVQITRFIIMRSENHIMGTCVSNRIILCYRNDKETKIILQRLKEELKTKYSICLMDERNEESKGYDIDKCLLSYIIQFTLVCKYVECGKWVHIWDNMDTIIESKFCGNNSSKYFNCIGFKFHILNTNYRVVARQKKNCTHFVQMHLKVMLNMYKVLPLLEEQICENMYVYCLPRCSMRGTILGVLDAADTKGEEPNFNYKDYWLNVHGYVLNENAVNKIIKVKLYKGVFNYPQGALLRENIYKLNVAVKNNNTFFYVCHFIKTFELLKGERIKLLRFSEWDEGGENIFGDLFVAKNIISVKKEQGDDQDDSEFYTKLNLICKHEFEENNFSESIYQSNKLQKTYDNSYHLYGNTLTTSGISINLDFSKNKKSHTGGEGGESSKRNLGTILKESAMTYYGRQVDLQRKPIEHEARQEGDYCARNVNPDYAHDLVDRMKDEGTTVVQTMNYQNKHAQKKKAQAAESYTVRNPNRKDQLDKYLHNVAKSYNSVEEKKLHHMAEVRMFENVNPQIIFSKDFENFLDNLDEAALYQQEPLLPPINFDHREKKRPNFPITSSPLGQREDHSEVMKTRKMM
ncbi:conserved Plasmodium protein, unknown function [Plasmodium knowlesi strain H]|uniref:Uncharacterized protein n=3 Tax=Plasmodium knowlesi TaxID=5850 RepID=A0A5K1U2W3_PLAKH|nr:conserved Plasmodium protein, unknown function [Plasmodium knowlesi strain H]OTN65420.1 Uncharacterized protein PKNOH_S110091500 [Plasmodium knowlesi]CAA9989534.1 conserved Plasmodium protein, unknown function [Plasmodium knowlesi strain H]SBO22535.1 conserved Plasmodium protein, unknown function [Plasmodium knowlesi strain H]SBO23609.1 conserved Plasmodium protein, unknown function [Plasmodium knowlesi strain H]VVS79008.1 conserved Plasmodium protein, unknown function [Plasmodium knowlesi |eukprot:XP_002260259.1 hypothetical protein, conserved in Plasmodium species [Plasmodium knowlesi strain H]